MKPVSWNGFRRDGGKTACPGEEQANRRRLPLWAMLTAALILACPGRGEPAPVSEKAGKKSGREGMQVHSVDRDADSSHAWIRIHVLCDTPAGETWEVIRGIEDWDEVMDLISRVEVLEENPRETRYKLRISPPWPLSDYFSIVRVREAAEGTELDYRVEEGFLFETFGKIAVGEDQAGSWIRFENLGSPQRRFPDWMVRLGIRLVVPSVLKDIRGRIMKNIRVREERRSIPYP